MTLALYLHPFSSFCQKVLIAFYENETPYEPHLVGGGDPVAQAELERLWPLGKFPVLRDEARGVTVAESSLIIDYIDRHYPGASPLIPSDPDAALPVHLWDRFFDNYVMLQMQAVVADTFRSEGQHDPTGVAMARERLTKAYGIIEAGLGNQWIAGSSFSLADCAAAPSLFYANLCQPFAGHARLEAYYRRLRERPSFARAVDEARQYRHFFPLGWPEGYD
jgi:glutathione S-transferase